jgi:tRNA-splicing ligase RtcB
MPGADPSVVSERAKERGRLQLGSLGSGNHFIEVGEVAEVFHPEAAARMGLELGAVTLMVHTGSRGLGHQVATDFLKIMAKKGYHESMRLPDRQLAAAPLDSSTGRDYLAAMAAAANFAWANRQVLMVLAERAMAKALDAKPETLGFRLVYDVSHNIAKIEEHEVEGRLRKLCVHRKGATRALPPGDPRLPQRYRDLGQPVLIPGDMGTESYVCIPLPPAEEHPFASSCHGAGRMMSRKAALKQGRGRSIVGELGEQGITVMAKDRRTLAEEMPEAYKDVSEVVDVLVEAGILAKVVRMKPLGVIKG